MLEFIFDLPIWVNAAAILAILYSFAIGGLLLVRRRILPRLRVTIEDSEFSGTLVQSVMVFYGLAVALIAVNVFQTHSDTSKIISDEATTLATLYRDVSSYPEPIRPRLQGALHDYVRYVIDQAWLLQRRGQVPAGGVPLLDRFQEILVAFEPATDGQRLLHGETLRAYNQMVVARRLRLDAVDTGLPTILWIVIVVGAFTGMISSFFFKVADVRLHAIQVTLLASFMGLIIVMTIALDRPFRGDLGLSARPYELVYEQLMKRWQ